MTTEFAIQIGQLEFGWKPGQTLLDIDRFELAAGESVFLVGPSGSGKSSLLAVIAGIAPASAGEIAILGQDMTALSPARRDAFRADNLGVIFQLFNLVPYLSPLDNVMLPCRFSKARRDRATRNGSLRSEAERLLNSLGLDAATISRASTELSVGQQQRVAAARALIGAPGLIIADEPTSALDSSSRDNFIELLQGECEAANSALLFVSHDESLGRFFDRHVDLADINRAGSVVA